jgi:hypothetical protein
MVPEVVIGLPVTERPVVPPERATLVTAVLQVVSPLQNVVALALVPEFKFVTGKFPVTSDERLTLPVDKTPEVSLATPVPVDLLPSLPEVSANRTTSSTTEVAVLLEKSPPPPPPGMLTVVVAPAPEAVTPAPVKLRVVTEELNVEPSSCVVIVPPPPLTVLHVRGLMLVQILISGDPDVSIQRSPREPNVGATVPL